MSLPWLSGFGPSLDIAVVLFKSLGSELSMGSLISFKIQGFLYEIRLVETYRICWDEFDANYDKNLGENN